MMQAMVRHAYGQPELLHLEEIERPTPSEEELLIRVHAASINLGDWELMTARPRYITLFAQLFGGRPRIRPPKPQGRSGSMLRPRYRILGCDLAGRVEAVGGRVTDFEPGDEVFGFSNFGAFAEYACVPERYPLVRKPASLSFEQAAALPQATFLAVQAIRDRGKVRAGQKVLVVGAGGGAGTLAVQLAKLHGAEVTGVDRGSKEEMVRSIGADHFIDYQRDDFLESAARYDLIFDLVAHRSAFRSMRALEPDGHYLAAGGTLLPFCQTILLGPLVSRLGSKQVGFLMAGMPRENLSYALELIEQGALTPVIDGAYPLSELPEALRRVGEGAALGKVVVTVP